ncbi:MAG: 3'(2'),5'-bisphosphate nucleotidase CysQ [Woeseiaceae bacterium]|nr:3'(2'),5'-bisphosphate nucleotidase CysQ [Woeseiaceae bacterium]
MDLTRLIEPVVKLCHEAGSAILTVYDTDFDVESKDDDSPLTRADMASHRCIVAGLGELTPDIPMISEESGLPDFEDRSDWDSYWLIDPLDGTREFVNRNGEFTVNVALIRDHRPVFGVVHVPVSRATYVGCEGFGAERRDEDGNVERLHVAVESETPVRVVGSRSHRGDSLNKFLEHLGDYELHPVGSSLKFCYVAEGSADVYPRLGPTSEWDTAAAQAVVEQAGGMVVRLDGTPLSYNTKSEILNPHFLVIGPQDYDWVGIARTDS